MGQVFLFCFCSKITRLFSILNRIIGGLMSEADEMPLFEQIHRMVETAWLLFLEGLNNVSFLGVSSSYWLLLFLLLLVIGGLLLFSRLRMLFLFPILILFGRARRAIILSHVDGDTVRVSAPHKNDKSQIPVRLIGIDTPESRRSMYMQIGPFGKESAEYTKNRLPKETPVVLVYDHARQDKFGRDLAYLYLRNGEFFNATLVKEGYAWADQHPPNVKFADYFETLQKKAQAKKLGLWKIYSAPGELRSEYKKTKEYKAFLQQTGQAEPAKAEKTTEAVKPSQTRSPSPQNTSRSSGNIKR
jgi:micrococcal nuclease